MRIKTFLAAGLVLALGSIADAATLSAGPLLVQVDPDNTNAIDCAVANVGNSPVTVRITARFVDGGSNGGSLRFLPGEVDGVRLSDNSETEARLGYCTFEVTGRASNVRATACVLDGRNNCRAAVRAH